MPQHKPSSETKFRLQLLKRTKFDIWPSQKLKEWKLSKSIILRYNLEEDTFAAIEVEIFTTGIVIQRRRNTKKGVEIDISTIKWKKYRTYCLFLLIDLCSCHDHAPKDITSPRPTEVQNTANQLGMALGNSPADLHRIYRVKTYLKMGVFNDNLNKVEAIEKLTMSKLDTNEKLDNADSKGKPTKCSHLFHWFSRIA